MSSSQQYDLPFNALHAVHGVVICAQYAAVCFQCVSLSGYPVSRLPSKDDSHLSGGRDGEPGALSTGVCLFPPGSLLISAVL